jgi:hypothetical protein
MVPKIAEQPGLLAVSGLTTPELHPVGDAPGAKQVRKSESRCSPR